VERGVKKRRLIIDVAKCENCQNCFLACKDEHVGNRWPGVAEPQPSRGPGWIEIRAKERGSYPLIDVAYLPVPCQHCDDAPCVRASANGEIRQRPDGTVLLDPEKAKGKKNLVNACPYGVIRWNEDLQAPQKCTLCAHLLDDGWDRPRCVQSCPTGALTHHVLDDGEMASLAERDGLEPCRPELGTRPRVLYRNLHRYRDCFVGGSVAARVKGVEECVENARVSVFRPNGEVAGECRTDAFGDFKIDRIKEGSGAWVLEVIHEDHRKRLSVTLGKSVNVGTVYLEE
jgi:Fe-S-cluster-containing dehydrogenase component